ncbi:thiolase family protein [Microbacterium hydrothermale]|uniref:thiolase family protein n=1 Tax=Microbacterium hydrothermale TaxID=857427 RepID=UPI0010A917F4|nr:acetyl-CoA C-acyltransferase [Microbacterium hydrothermale]
MTTAVIADSTRTPIGRAGRGSLRDVRPDDLAAGVIREVVGRSGVDPDLIEDVILGTAYPQGKAGSNMGRRVVPLAGLPLSVPGTTVNRFCASSLQAIRMAAHAVRAGEADALIAAGVESVSMTGRGTAAEDQHPDLVMPGGIADMYISMGETAENVADRYGVARTDMDAFALRSHRLAIAAQDDGTTAREITPVQTPDGRVIDTDDGPRRTTSAEILASLPPAFRVGGAVTAGNSCPLNDGAAAVLVTSEDLARREGLGIRARIIGTAVSGIAPEIMGVGPIEAVTRLLERTGRRIEDIDAIEFNEAFAAQVLATARETGMDIDRQVNLRGGSIALGHPFGMSGARLVATLLTTLETIDGTLGLATMCVGGGQGMALLVERV